MNSIIKHKKILAFLLTISVLTLLLFSENIFAISPTVNIEPTQEENSDVVTLKISGLTHVETSGFKIRVNYNNSAFDYIGVDFPESLSSSSKSDDINDEGILTVECTKSYLPIGENDYFYINLRAKSSGAASVLVANSTFYDLQGNNISGSMLKYFTIEIKPFTNQGSVSQGQGDSPQLTNQQDEPENSSTLADANATTTEASSNNNDNKKTENQSSIPKASITTANSNSFSTEKTNETEATKVKYDFKILILISALIVLVLLIFYILKKSNKNKKR